jgi:3-methyl-2-oxobutanoate hydroxymethyltransferase
MKKVTISTLLQLKQKGEKIAALTAYDASFAKLFDEQFIDVMLIGDSLGMVLKGDDDTLSVSVSDLAYHTACVRKGTDRAFVISDMPFMSYATPELAYANAAKLMANGANMVKLEGVERGIPVCGHLGLTPQSVHVFGGFKVQGRENEQAQKILDAAIKLEKAGIQLLVLECIPSSVAKLISEALTIPVIGIGAGVGTDGQILVMHDMFGISANYMPKFSKNYLLETNDMRAAVAAYIEDVKASRFPGPEHSFE